jgi:hypothetical protein
MKSSSKIAVENVNVPVASTCVNAVKYGAIREVLLRVLPEAPPGLTQAEMLAAVRAGAPHDLFPGGDKSGWWTKTVQLDLEAKGMVVRDVKSKPLRWWRAK